MPHSIVSTALSAAFVNIEFGIPAIPAIEGTKAIANTCCVPSPSVVDDRGTVMVKDKVTAWTPVL